MKKIYKKILVFAITSIIGIPIGTAQHIKATVEATEGGFQTIAVPQEFRARIGDNIGSLRIINQKGEEVPFILKPEATTTTGFKPMTFNKEVEAGDSTETILLDNPDKLKKQRYLLKIANSTATKPYTIEGSDDQQTWFSLVPRGYISDLYSETETYSTKSISFPLMDYRFVRIKLDNKDSAPINILEIGEMETQHRDESYEKLRNTSWKQAHDREKKTSIVTISKEGNSPIDFIKVHISAPNQYLREAEIYKNVATNRKNQNYKQTIEYITLNSATKNEFAVEIDGRSDFHIGIFNEDNSPLTIDSISLYQKPIQLLAELKRGFTYTLDADTGRKMPNYDLAKINLQLPDQLPNAEITKIEIPLDQLDDKKGTYGSIILIVCSILGVLAVFYFGNSLLRDMKKEK